MFDKYLEFVTVCLDDVPTSISVGLLLVFCLGTVLLLVFLRCKKGFRWSARLLLFEYLLLILLLTVVFRAVKRAGSFNFVPFWSYPVIRAGNKLLLTQAIMNVIAFIPIGLLLGLSFPKMKWWKALLVGGAFSITIETLQFIFQRGFTEFDDVFHNVLGCLIGYGVYAGVRSLVRRIPQFRK